MIHSADTTLIVRGGYFEKGFIDYNGKTDKKQLDWDFICVRK